MVAGMGVGLFLVAWLTAQVSAGREPQATACPSPSELEAELVRAGAVGLPAPDITVNGEHMRVVLRGPDGALLGSRDLEVPTTCHERATVAAVLVATWMGVWPAAPAPSPRPLPPLPPAPSPAPKIAPPPATELGLELGGAHDGNGSAVAAALSIRRVLAGPLRIAVGAVATTERERRVGAGRAGYLRPTVELGPVLRLGRGALQGELGASARLALLWLRGKGVVDPRQVSHPAPGAAASVRVVLARERLSPFFAAGVGYWFTRQKLTLDDDDANAELPQWDATAGLGLLWSP